MQVEPLQEQQSGSARKRWRRSRVVDAELAIGAPGSPTRGPLAAVWPVHLAVWRKPLPRAGRSGGGPTAHWRRRARSLRAPSGSCPCRQEVLPHTLAATVTTVTWRSSSGILNVAAAAVAATRFWIFGAFDRGASPPKRSRIASTLAAWPSARRSVSELTATTR